MARSTDDILRVVKGLIDKANDPIIADGERQVLLDKADALMLKHSLEEWQLMAAMSKEERRKPVVVRFHAADANAPHWEKFRTVLHYIAKLYRVRAAFHYDGDVTLVGYTEDVSYVQTKFLSVYLHFSKTIDPRWDNSLTVDHNVYNFKVAGRQWQSIQETARDNGHDKPMHFFKPAYQRHCKLIGETPRPHTQRNRQYRESFVQAFVYRVVARIEELMSDRDKAASEAGALVAVKDLGADVDEMFYDLFEHLRPTSPEEMEAMIAARRAQREREERELQERLEKMTPAQRRRYDEAQERERRKEAREDKKYWREQDKKYDSEGAGAGRTSADNVDLSDQKGGVASQTRREL